MINKYFRILIALILIASSTSLLSKDEKKDKKEDATRAKLLFRHEFNTGFGYKFNRTLSDTMPLFFQYSFLFDNHWNFKTGFSFNLNSTSINGYYFDFAYNNLVVKGLDLGIKFNNYNYAQYGKGSNSIIPWIRIEYVFFFKLGIAFHFFNPYAEHIYNIFYYFAPGFETAFYYSLGYHLKIVKNIYDLHIEINNHDRFYAGTNAYIGLMIKNDIIVHKNIMIFFDLELRLSGSIALASNFYIFGVYTGVTFRLDH